VPRELSAGGVAVRRMRGRWWFAAIEPAGRPDVLALPKGLIDPGEAADVTALREVREEAGITCSLDRRVTDVRYVYTRGGQRIFKIVVFFLLRYRSGRIGDIEPAMRREVASAAWIPLTEWRRLSYGGERDAARAAFDMIEASTAEDE
jgi:8-oxo-dGTP pyrophosphatase MutT (NUDIX family)